MPCPRVGTWASLDGRPRPACGLLLALTATPALSAFHLAIPGVGPVLAAVFVAEIGEVDRLPGLAQLASWAGLTPRHRESDLVMHRGRITKQGSTLVRWAAVEAAHGVPHTAGWLTYTRARVAERPGRNIATPSRWPANCSPSSTTASATGTSVPCVPARRRREQVRT
ncbi:transposase [Micromonospora chersina]|uniref:transposase n=1 Tax=Micromonospora chersina TaxID=47854 RepID=UPI00371F6D03